MRKRLIASIVGCVIGLCAASWLQDALGVSEAMAYIACAAGGIVLAYVASMMLDVFAGGMPPGSTPK